MQIHRAKNFTPKQAWDALDIANMNGITCRLHWTNQAYRWHVNDGQEVFAVLTGEVIMEYETEGAIESSVLKPGDIFYGSLGTKHKATPIGEARILVIEKQGSL
ncbi:cupin [Paraglaciecola sp. 2405UD69-4]|uniref:cupin n=1 Tax=Paraglaciecola sp. 2405UD69-4 TaxID=3391836 RepID=UPI0039C94197